MINGLVVPTSFRGQTMVDMDLSKLKNCHFVVIEMSEDVDTPNDSFWIGVDRCWKAGIPCFAMWSFDPVALHADVSNGGTRHFDQLFSLVKNKALYGLFLHITNTADDSGSDLPAVNMALMIQHMLEVSREQIPAIPPGMVTRDTIMLMTDVATIGRYTSTQDVPTQLSREQLLAPSDIYWDINNITRMTDMSMVDSIYSSLELIGLDGKPHPRQDSIYALNPWGHWWAKDAFQTPAVTLSGGGEGVCGAMKFYGSLEDLEDWCDMEINVNEDDPTPDQPGIEIKVDVTAIQAELKKASGALGRLIDLMPE